MAIAAASTGAAAQAGKWGQSVSSRFTDNPNLINLGGYLASGVASALIRTAFGGRMDVTAVAADVFGNALGNSIVDGMQPTPRSSGIGLTDEQLADMNRQVEAGYLASQGQFDDQLQRDVRQQQFQMSLQSDIERSLNNNPDFVANLPMPRAEFVIPAPTISRQARLDRDLMEQAIAGGVRTSLFNSSIENAFDTQLLDKLTRASVVDLRPTRENAIALGHEQRVDYYPHITAKMRPWDPAADARAKLAGNAIGSMVMNPFAAAGYLAGQATGNEDFALASSVLFGAAGDLFLAGAGSRSISRSMFAEPVALRPKVPLGYDVSKWAEYGLPSDGNFVRTLTREQYLDFKAGREFSFGGRPAEGYPSGMGFIGSAEEVRGISTAAGYREALKLDYTPQYLLEFQLRSPARLQNVLSAPYAEFVPGGRSGAGFMERARLIQHSRATWISGASML